jgi:serine/threonine protein kinase
MPTLPTSQNYISPEVLANETYFDGFAVDLWASAIVLFIMLVGLPPFEWARLDDRRYQIVRQGGLEHLCVQWKRPISPVAMDLLKGMIIENPFMRKSLFQVMNHAWVLDQSPVTPKALERLSPFQDLTSLCFEQDDSDSDGSFGGTTSSSRQKSGSSSRAKCD